MAWSADDAKACCDQLLKALTKLLPEVNWEEPGSLGDHGLLFFVNDDRHRVRVVVSREAMERYVASDAAGQIFQQKRLASYIRILAEERVMGMFIGPDHLIPE